MVTPSDDRISVRDLRNRGGDVLARVQHHYYDAGHMMYTREADLRKLKRDLAAWLTA